MDPSGIHLRKWMNIDEDTFYDRSKIALIPMGFCYPGTGKYADHPPRKECAPQWHDSIFPLLTNIEFTLLIGSFAQNYYLGQLKKKTMTETVRSFKEYLPDYFVLPHPSPRNNIWIKKNPWFEKEVIPRLQEEVRKTLGAKPASTG